MRFDWSRVHGCYIAVPRQRPRQRMKRIISIDAPHFAAAVVLEQGLVTRAAPILSYMHGWSLEEVQAYVKRKRWRIVGDVEQ